MATKMLNCALERKYNNEKLLAASQEPYQTAYSLLYKLSILDPTIFFLCKAN